MTTAQMTAKLDAALESQNALVLNCGDKVFARVFDGTFVNAYVHSFTETEVTFQTLNGFQWLMTVEEAAQDTFLIERYNRAQLIEEIKALWLAKVA